MTVIPPRSDGMTSSASVVHDGNGLIETATTITMIVDNGDDPVAFLNNNSSRVNLSPPPLYCCRRLVNAMNEHGGQWAPPANWAAGRRTGGKKHSLTTAAVPAPIQSEPLYIKYINLLSVICRCCCCCAFGAVRGGRQGERGILLESASRSR